MVRLSSSPCFGLPRGDMRGNERVFAAESSFISLLVVESFIMSSVAVSPFVFTTLMASPFMTSSLILSPLVISPFVISSFLCDCDISSLFVSFSYDDDDDDNDDDVDDVDDDDNVCSTDGAFGRTPNPQNFEINPANAPNMPSTIGMRG